MRKTPRLFVPAITPFRADLSVDHARFVTNCKALLADGADGLAPFGTTSEANSMSVDERIEALDALLAGGVAPTRLIPGTGCCALADSIRLTRDALSKGCMGVLVLPPFYYKNVPEDGLFAAFAGLIDAIGDSRLRVYLYHIPQFTGVPVTLSLTERLLKAYPRTIAGLKDSSGNRDNTRAFIEAFPDLDVFSASEALIPQNVAAGGAGCISASANVNARAIVALMRALGSKREAAIAAQVTEVRKLFESLPLIPAIKAVTARRHGDMAYAQVRPPFAALDGRHDADIARATRLCQDFNAAAEVN